MRFFVSKHKKCYLFDLTETYKLFEYQGKDFIDFSKFFVAENFKLVALMLYFLCFIQDINIASFLPKIDGFF